jgi:thioredoxin 1
VSFFPNTCRYIESLRFISKKHITTRIGGNQKVLQSDAPVLVDFYADWCRPCQALAPVLDEFARETPNAKIVKVNVDQNPELAAHYQIESIPRLLVFRGGRLTAQHAGMANKAALKRLLFQ